MDERLKLLFKDLEDNAYNHEYHNYYYKQANQIIRKHFEALSLGVVSNSVCDHPYAFLRGEEHGNAECTRCGKKLE